MAEPVVVIIPHKLGKEEAIRRLKNGFSNVRSTFGEKFVVLTDAWNGNHLDFRASLLGQTTDRHRRCRGEQRETRSTASLDAGAPSQQGQGHYRAPEPADAGKARQDPEEIRLVS